MALDLENLRVFLHVADQGSVQRAAESLRISRTSLRRRLENLEAQVGTQLLEPSNQGITLTNAGTVLRAQGQELLNQASEMVARAKASEDHAGGMLRLILPVGQPVKQRVAAALALKAARPDLIVVAREVEDPLAHLHEPFELMVHLGPPPKRGDWYTRVLMRLPVRLLASPGYLSRAGTPRALEDLTDHALMSWETTAWAGDRWPLRDGGTFRVAPFLRTSNVPVLFSLAAASAGIVLVPNPLGDLDMDRAGELVPVLEDVVGGDCFLRALTPRGSSRTSGAQLLLKSIQTMLETLPLPS